MRQQYGGLPHGALPRHLLQPAACPFFEPRTLGGGGSGDGFVGGINLPERPRSALGFSRPKNSGFPNAEGDAPRGPSSSNSVTNVHASDQPKVQNSRPKSAIGHLGRSGLWTPTGALANPGTEVVRPKSAVGLSRFPSQQPRQPGMFTEPGQDDWRKKKLPPRPQSSPAGSIRRDKISHGSWMEPEDH